MATIEATPNVAPGTHRWSHRLELGTLACTLLLALLAFVVLYPLALLLINSFQVAGAGRTTTFQPTEASAPRPGGAGTDPAGTP